MRRNRREANAAPVPKAVEKDEWCPIRDATDSRIGTVHAEIAPGLSFFDLLFLGAVMFSRMGIRIVAIFVAASMLIGCAELDRKGGYIDQIEDAVFFRADTKTHRLLRSYLLATVLLTAARRQGHNDVDRTAIAGALEGALAVANEAYMCLYPGLLEATETPATYPVDPSKLRSNSSIGAVPDEIVSWTHNGQPIAVVTPNEKPRWCQFFDEKMSRLDYALFRLASVTLFNDESRLVLADIQSKLIGKIPVVSDTVLAAIHVNKAVNQVTTIIDDLLTVAFKSAGPVLALLPLYRDSLELNMWVVTDNYALWCKAESSSSFDASLIIGPISDTPWCTKFKEAMFALQKGNNNPRIWRAFLNQQGKGPENDLNYILAIEAYRPHFFLISQLLMRSCQSVLSDGQKPSRCRDVLVDALEKAAFNADNATGNLINRGGPPTPSRWMTVSLPLPGAKFVQLRPRRPAPAVAAAAKPAIPAAADPQSTGAIGQPKAPATAPATPPTR